MYIVRKQRKIDMSYMIDKWNAGEVVVIADVCGWEFKEGFDGGYEHRPLMADAMKELLEAGLVTTEMVEATETARHVNTNHNINIYLEARANRTPEQIAEENAEMRAAFGPGETVVNVISGERTTL